MCKYAVMVLTLDNGSYKYAMTEPIGSVLNQIHWKIMVRLWDIEQMQ